MIPPLPTSTLFPYTTLFRSAALRRFKSLVFSKYPHESTSHQRSPRSFLGKHCKIRSRACRRLLRRSLHLDRDRRHHWRSEEHTSELQSQSNLVCRLLLEKKN